MKPRPQAQGFGKTAEAKKSKLQQVRKTFRRISPEERKYSLKALQEVKLLKPETSEELEADIQASDASDRSLEGTDIDSCGGESTFGQLSPIHLKELVEKSAIDPEIAALNWRTAEGEGAWELMLYSPALPRTNTGRLCESVLKRYHFLDEGGLYCAGLDPLTGENSLWGCLKPNNPPIDPKKNQPRKYIHPEKVSTEAFFLRVPSKTWALIARRYEVELPEGYETLPYKAFWDWVAENAEKIPVIITEGAKKAGSILSCGYVAIALPGVRGGYRQPRNEYGENDGSPYLIPQISAFAQPKRRVYFCFDADTKRTTIRDVNSALSKTGRLFESRGCEVRVLGWSAALGKGADDLIAGGGREAFDDAYRLAMSLSQWNTKQMKRLTYVPDVSLSQRFLGEIDIPVDAQLIALKSPKSTGKTHFFEWITDPMIRSGEKKVLVITHRVQLGLQLAARLGLPYISESHPQGSHFGTGMCIDSVCSTSQARFNPEEWKGAWVIFDEIMQMIWHLLTSSTCDHRRVAIVKSLKQLLLNVVNHGGKIFIADADLSDIAIDFIKGLIGQDVRLFLVENDYRFEEPWDIQNFKGKNPAQLVKFLQTRLEAGEKHFLCLSGQRAKSRWGSTCMEALFAGLNPQLKILRIDSRTVADPRHPAFGCTQSQEKLHKLIAAYDLVIATPTIETGVSIEIEHFDGVWGIFQGVQTPDSVRQHLSRYRPPVPRYIWVKEVGINRVGSGATNPKALLASESRKDKANVKKLLDIGFGETINGSFESICIQTWAKLGAIINDGMAHYRRQILDDLRDEGHRINEENFITKDDPDDEDELLILDLPSEPECEAMKDAVAANCEAVYKKYNNAVSAAPSVVDEKFLRLDKQASKTSEEQLEYHKGKLERKYLVPVDPDLIEKDDDNWYSKIRLHYYFAQGREFLADRDKNVMAQALKNGDGDYFKVSTNKSLLGKKVDGLDWINFGQLLEVDEISNSHPLAQEFFEKVMLVDPKTGRKQNLAAIREIFGVNLSAKSPMVAITKFLRETIGYEFPCLRREGGRGEQVRIYGKPASGFERDEKGKIILKNGQPIPIPDRREEVFAAWIARDTLAREKAREKAMALKLEEETQAAAKQEAQDSVVEMLVEYLPQCTIKEECEELFAASSEEQKAQAWQRLDLKEQERIHSLFEMPSAEPMPSESRILEEDVTEPIGKRCWVYGFDRWTEAVIHSWEHRPHEKFFKSVVELLETGMKQIVWQREALEVVA